MNADTLAAVLWDMDGTLVDTEPLWLRAELAMLDRFGIEFTQELRDSLVGSGLSQAAERFRALGVSMTVDEIVAEWVAEVSRGISAGEFEWRPGARELLDSLRDSGVPCALVTMSTRSLADSIVALLPSGAFTAVIAGDEVAHEKPHPEPYLLGAAALGVPIGRCVALEDSPTGLRSASTAGAVAIGIPNLLSLDTAPSHDIVHTLAGIDAHALAQRYSELSGEDPRPRTERTPQEARP